MKLFEIDILSQKELGPDYFLAEMRSSKRITPVTPGTFLMISFPDRVEPLLPRPMAFYKILEDSADSTVFSIVYRVVGKGTHLLAGTQPGDKLRGVGPLGNGWDLDAFMNAENVVFIAGGIGITTFYNSARELINNKNNTPKLFYGASSSSDLVLVDDFESMGVPTEIFTEDGSAGIKGMATDRIAEILNEGKTEVLACGPYAMLQKVNEVCQDLHIDPQLSFDKRMACGFGVCLGCNLGVFDGDGERVKQVRVCKEGPVFQGSEVAW